jgi:hypothetical protein
VTEIANRLSENFSSTIPNSTLLIILLSEVWAHVCSGQAPSGSTFVRHFKPPYTFSRAALSLIRAVHVLAG